MEFFLMLMIHFSDQPTRRMYYQYASLAECAEARELYSKDRAGARIGEAAFSGKDGRLVRAVCTGATARKSRTRSALLMRRSPPASRRR